MDPWTTYRLLIQARLEQYRDGEINRQRLHAELRKHGFRDHEIDAELINIDGMASCGACGH